MRHKGYRLAGAVLAGPTFVCLLGHVSPILAAANPLGPAAVIAGPVALTPLVGVEIKHRDNIYLQQRNETDSWIYLLRPAVNAQMEDRDNRYQLDYRGEAGWYETSSSDDYFDNTFSGDAHMEFSERWIVEGNASWASLHEDRGTGLTEGLVGELVRKPVKYDQTDVGGSVQYGSDQGVGRLLLKAGYMDREYRNLKDFTRTRDRDETTFGVTFFHPVAPKTDLLVEYVYTDINYSNPFEVGPPLDSDEYSLMLGVDWEITPNLSSTAQVGYIDKSFDDSQRRDWDGVGWLLALRMQPREQDTIFVRSSRAPEETTRQGDFIKREALTVTWTHDWSDRIFTQIGGMYGRDTYERSIDDREDDIYNASFRVGYEFRRWANTYMGYSYDDKDSNVDNLSYTDNVFNIGVEFSL